MTRTQAIEKQIEEIMDEFDFALCAEIFEQNDWKYYGETEPPSVGDLRRHCRKLLWDVAVGDCFVVSGGRFTARKREDRQERWVVLTLEFTPVSWEAEGEFNQYE